MRAAARGGYAAVILLLALGSGGAGCGSSAKGNPDAGNPDAGVDLAALHIGRACQLSIDPVEAGISPASSVIDVGLECPTRICLLLARETATDTTSLCTAFCSGDEDCQVAEARDTTTPSDRRCERGFSCMVAETEGDFCCRKLCLCNDFFGVKPPATPEVCAPTPVNRAHCPNIN